MKEVEYRDELLAEQASGAALPRDEDGHIVTDARFGEAYIVEIEWNTDFDGREIDPGKEEYARTLHGPFADEAEAKAWLEAYPDDTDIHEMTVVVLNRARPETPVEKTWTFFGHWDGDLVIDHAVVGEHDDVYPDQGEYEEGVWAASASGATIEEAEANARAEYEEELPDCGEDFMAGTICSLPEGHEGPHAPICRRCGVDWYLNDGCKCPPSTDD